MTPKSLGRLERDRTAKAQTSALGIVGDLNQGLCGIADGIRRSKVLNTVITEATAPEIRARAGLMVPVGAHGGLQLGQDRGRSTSRNSRPPILPFSPATGGFWHGASNFRRKATGGAG